MRKSLLLSILLMGFPLVASAQGVHYDNSPSDLTGGGTITGNVSISGEIQSTSNLRLSCATCYIYQQTRGTNALPYELMISAGSAYASATGANLIGGDLFLRGGIGGRTITVTNYALSAGDTISVTITTTASGPTTTTFTEGITFNCASSGSNTACASALASAFGSTVGVSVSSSGAVVRLTPSDTALAIEIEAPADGGVDGVFATRTNSADGQILLGGTGTSSGIAFASDPDTLATPYLAASNYACYRAGGATPFCFSALGISLGSTSAIKTNGRSLLLGDTTCVTSHSLVDGDTCNKGKIEIKGPIYLDGIMTDVGATCTTGDFKVDTAGGTTELCYCTATDTWFCAAMASGAAD